MAEKRSFYGKGIADGFSRRDFYNAVLALVKGEEVENMEAVAGAAEYELETLDLKAAKSAAKSSGEKKDVMESDYAQAIVKDVIRFVTAQPQTAAELVAQATSKGLKAPSGKEYSPMWVARIANLLPDVTVTEKIVEVTKDGLKSQKKLKAYVKA